MIFNLGNWLLKLQAPGGDTSIFLLQAVKWVTGAAGLALLVLGAHVFLTADLGRLESGDSSERQTAILYMSLGVGCVVAFLIWYIRMRGPIGVTPKELPSAGRP